eukprot:TRINITY_DN4968_c0_g2_i1.p1 TRINITY_DN4968_c0_g2~~TRINITY_DN4968_c0_g2_i1.p1  ORF type:complete len:363 (-),score=46.48 TRINITY_DN4968_c0_g2_i1:50-1138(-)
MSENQEVIIWVDSDPNVAKSSFLQKEGFKVLFYNETAEAIKFLSKSASNCLRTKCIITSMMERGGRKERGLLNGIQMIQKISQLFKENQISVAPLLAIVTLTADREICNENGIEICVYGDRKHLQDTVLERLKISSDRTFRRLWDEDKSITCKSLRVKAKKVLEYLNLNPNLLNNFADHCFCFQCEKTRIYYRGEPCERYAVPLGWYRYGIAIRPEFESLRSSIEGWHVAYHGTKHQLIGSILQHKRIVFPGDKLQDGSRLPVRLGQCWKDKVSPKGDSVIYLSPTIYYSSLPIYAPPFKVDSVMYQVVLQVRIHPKCYKKFPETVGLKNRLDPDFTNDEIEWVTADRSGVVPFGLLIKPFR